MAKKLEYTIKVKCDPVTVNPSAILEALRPFGEVEITGSAIRRE